MFERAMVVAGALRRSGLHCEAINLHLADGELAGQEINHVHIHVIPRHRDDGFGLRVGPDYGRIADRAGLDEIAVKVIEIDKQGKIRLSRKEALKPEGESDREGQRH